MRHEIFSIRASIRGRKKITSEIFFEIDSLSQKFLTFSDFFFVPKKFRFMIPIIIHTLPPQTHFPTDACQDFLMFFRRSEFYMTIRVSHTFLLFFWGVWGAKPPRKFWRIFRLIFNIFVSVKSFFAFLGGSGGEAPRKFLRFFSFLTRGGATENFF